MHIFCVFTKRLNNSVIAITMWCSSDGPLIAMTFCHCKGRGKVVPVL